VVEAEIVCDGVAVREATWEGVSDADWDWDNVRLGD